MVSSAAQTIREARHRARLTQSQLAARAGLAQSVVSAYESSRREPSVPMLSKLVAAAGFELSIALGAPQVTSPLRQIVSEHRQELNHELRALGASRVRLFGSVARGDDGPQSDVDLLVDVDGPVGLFALGRMRSTAARILGTHVDVVPSNSLKPDVAKRVLAEAVPL